MSHAQRPGRNLATIPRVDLSPFARNEGVVAGSPPTIAQLKAAKDINDGLSKTGVICITKHGIPSTHIASYYEAGYQLFQKSQKDKINALPRLDMCKKFGYIPSMSETFSDSRNADLKEGFLFCGEHTCEDFSGLPSLFPLFAKTATKDKLVAFDRLCHGLELAGDLPSGLLSSRFRRMDTAISRLNYFYPLAGDKEEEASDSKSSMRFGEHTDWNAVTMLFMDGPGLQIKAREEGCEGEEVWMDVAVPVGDEMIVMAGETVERWTNDVWKAPKHRVVNATGGKERMSVAHFFHPDRDQMISVLPKFVGKEGKKYDDVMALDFLVMRLRETRKVV